MMEIVYFDTSALAKWYLNEESSHDVEQYIQEHGPVAISELTVVEMRCLLARRRREKQIDPKLEIRVFGTFEEDIREGFLVCHSLPNGVPEGAVNLISVLPDVPLRTLDALHLVIAKEIHADVVATADRVMAEGARAMDLSVVQFGRPRHR
jgi:hypothetical protein